MDIINTQVRHNKYGIGAVIEQADNIITVKFPTESETKRFLYPSIFENYLTFCSEELQTRQMEEISRQKAEYEVAVTQQKAAAEEQRKKELKPAPKRRKKMISSETKA
ncbi:hypothetical protein SAMN02745823_01523 [Sporobacter termitidis DSM 10068]|uniref:Uncharacterized protein n=1 Tax=Sporobacter termitidis DSM 10068 TaxID=1123282 RepID=A0A1M5X122_9FIRM|nr:hypothetical protein [Sporobacter termitidis]SHH93615.1 hypothetical protein SAMN02745823_01523 [Sporobacter termitidis DSM 10068]